MRELTLQELELVAGGTSTAIAVGNEIVVTASPGDDGGYHPWIFGDAFRVSRVNE